MNLLTNDTAAYRGVRTGLQAFGGFLFGLIVVIATTPGLPERVQAYLQPYEMQVFLWMGVPTILGASVLGYLTTIIREKLNKPVVTPPTEAVAETGIDPTEQHI